MNLVQIINELTHDEQIDASREVSLIGFVSRNKRKHLTGSKFVHVNDLGFVHALYDWASDFVPRALPDIREILELNSRHLGIS